MSTKNLFNMTKIINKLVRLVLKQDGTDKGHFAIYTTDMRRFMVPLACLENEIFRELLKLSEDEFGLPCEGPIMLPCDAFFVEYVMSLISQGSAGDLEKALILSVVTSRCSSPAGSDLQRQFVC